MSLLNPLGLLGLLSLPVIVALHLLRERQRRYVVSDLGLWSFLDMEPRGPRTRRIPLTPLLLIDLLIAALLTLAFTQPRLALDLPTPGAVHTVILLDTSTSMRAEDAGASRFEQARAQINDLLDHAGPNDVITLLTFGRRASLVADSRTDGLETLVQRLNALQAGETAGKLTGATFQAALARGEAALDGSLPAEFQVFSDGSFALGNPAGAAGSEVNAATGLEELTAFAYPLRWRWTGRPAENQAAVRINAVQVSENRLQVFARFANFSGGWSRREAVVEVDGREISRATVETPPDSTLPRVWQLTIDPNRPPAQVSVRLRGTDALDEDDSAMLSLQAGGVVQVALVADDPSLLQQAVSAVPGAELTVMAPGEYDRAAATGNLPRADLYIFRDYLPLAWPAGPALIVEPPSLGGSQTGLPENIAALSAGARQEVPAGAIVQVPNVNPVVAGVDFSGVRWNSAWSLVGTPAGFSPLLVAADVPLLLRGSIALASGGSSPVTVLLADLRRGNFTQHPAFPILIANLVDDTRRAPLPAVFQTGETLALPSQGVYRSIEIVPPAGDPVRFSNRWPLEWAGALEPGVYRFRLETAAGERREFITAANAGDAAESDLRPQVWNAAVESTGGQAVGMQAEKRQIDLSFWLLGAAVLALLVEAYLAWRRA